MDVTTDDNEGKYENYADDSFYLELERQIVQLIDNSEEVNPRRSVSSSVAKNPNIITGNTGLLQRLNYYNWSVCAKSIGPDVSSYIRAAAFTGTGVFIPQTVKYEIQDCKKYYN